MEPKYHADEVIGHPNHYLRIWLDAYKVGPYQLEMGYDPYKWPYKLVTGVITLLIGVITPLGPPCREIL